MTDTNKAKVGEQTEHMEDVFFIRRREHLTNSMDHHQNLQGRYILSFLSSRKRTRQDGRKMKHLLVLSVVRQGKGGKASSAVQESLLRPKKLQ